MFRPGGECVRARARSCSDSLHSRVTDACARPFLVFLLRKLSRPFDVAAAAHTFNAVVAFKYPKNRPETDGQTPHRTRASPRPAQQSVCVQMAKADQRYGQRDGSDQNFDYMFKLLIIGNSSVGKTSFLFRYADDSFSNSFVSTVGIDFKVKTVYRNDKRIKLQIWDTAGQERYRTITTAYYRGAMGFILMYDITNEESFNAVQDWATQIKTYSWDNAQVIMVGNKCDLDEERVVALEKGKHLADQLGFEYYEASAKENVNVRQVFERLVDIICVKMSERVDVEAPAASGTKTARLSDKPAGQLPQKCC
ncbi:ras-related protein Rab-3A isoform X1 [Syngnathus scovelli]|uniref:ras-related protein Rab-3A isoform X1 n=2 Tax=Syngnathus scovelli TaxID=161590 RepID=UPI0021106CAF|nr:ras-related protein Rab-3A isoform X1 [Syngnathus scovelli]